MENICKCRVWDCCRGSVWHSSDWCSLFPFLSPSLFFIFLLFKGKGPSCPTFLSACDANEQSFITVIKAAGRLFLQVAALPLSDRPSAWGMDAVRTTPCTASQGYSQGWDYILGRRVSPCVLMVLTFMCWFSTGGLVGTRFFPWSESIEQWVTVTRHKWMIQIIDPNGAVAWRRVFIDLLRNTDVQRAGRRAHLMNEVRVTSEPTAWAGERYLTGALHHDRRTFYLIVF